MQNSQKQLDNGGQGWFNPIMDKHSHSLGEPPKSNCGNPPALALVGEPELNGLIWKNFAGSQLAFPHYDREAYQAYLTKYAIVAGPPLDKSGWPGEVPLAQFERSADLGNNIAYTYFVEGHWSKRIKIGQATDLNRRANQLSWTERENITFLATLRGKYFETIYHNAFAEHRIEGEWFMPHPDILAEIERLSSVATPPSPPDEREAWTGSKKQKEALRAMFGGRCAYCGNVMDKMHADHVEPCIRVTRDPWGKPLAEPYMMKPERNTVANMMPACAPCNLHKGSYPLEAWRTYLQRSAEIVRKQTSTFKAGERFGIINVTEKPVRFYFEALAKCDHLPSEQGEG